MFATIATPSAAKPPRPAHRQLLAMADVPRELAALYPASTVKYGQVYYAIQSGHAPAVAVGSRMFLDRADLPLLAAAFGLIPVPEGGRRRIIHQAPHARSKAMSKAAR